MFIDILFLLVIALSIFKGYNKGLVVAVFTFISTILGLIIAIKFSSVVANWMQNSTEVSAFWLPFLSFTLVMVAVVLIVRIAAKIIDKIIDLVLLGWLNKLGGILFFACIYISILSVVLFYFEKMYIIDQETIKASFFYFFIKPWALNIVSGFGYILPFFKNVILQLENFYKQNTFKIN